MKNALEGKLPAALIPSEYRYSLTISTYEASQMVVGRRFKVDSSGAFTPGVIEDTFGILKKDRLAQIVERLIGQGAKIIKVDGLNFSGTPRDAIDICLSAAACERAEYTIAA
jgi:hypothetical protein